MGNSESKDRTHLGKTRLELPLIVEILVNELIYKL
jgi:hypothetical protein